MAPTLLNINNPSLTVLNFSGGTQSSCLAWMVIRGEIEVDLDRFVIMTADPGMENSHTYEYNEMIGEECKAAGIECYKASGPDLYSDLINLDSKTRIDNPPYWIKRDDGSVGMLRQLCTKYYKIDPMLKSVRKILNQKFGTPFPPASKNMPVVEQWIGFSADEMRRANKATGNKKRPEYSKLRYPLIELGMNATDVHNYFVTIGKPSPARSLCNGCFAHGLRSLKDMHDNRPGDWRQAVAVDQSIRDMSCLGVKYPAFVSKTLVPLEELAERDFDLGNVRKNDIHSCDTGMCFV